MLDLPLVVLCVIYILIGLLIVGVNKSGVNIFTGEQWTLPYLFVANPICNVMPFKTIHSIRCSLRPMKIKGAKNKKIKKTTTAVPEA